VLTGTSDSSFGTIILWSSSHNTIENSFFRINGNFEGDRPTQKQFHAVYCLKHASNNMIRGNNFSRISGPAVKLKDASNYNTIENNRFSGIVVGAAIQDHYKRDSQAPSWQNRFTDNTVTPNHSGKTPVYGVEVQYPVLDDRNAARLFPRVIVSGNAGNAKANTTIYWMADNTSYEVAGGN
jgi:parallel beta-helix repeat protein